MGYSFTMVFEGVCAFVPDKPFFSVSGPGNATRMDVLIPDLRVAQEATFDSKVMRAAHFPVLSFDLDNLDERNSTRAVDLVAREFASKQEFGLSLLRHELISIEIPGTQPNALFSYEDQVSAGDVPKPGEEKSVFWLPRMSEIDVTKNRVLAQKKLNPRVFDPSGGAMPEELIAAVEVTSGRFHCVDFNRDLSGKPAVWRFATNVDLGAGAWKRVIGNRLGLSFIDLDERTQPIRLKLQRRAATAREETWLEFRPRLGQKSIDIELSNLEPEELFADSGLSPDPSPDPDFEEFYRRIAGDDKDAVIPHLGLGQTGLGSVRKPCAPVAFDGYMP